MDKQRHGGAYDRGMADSYYRRQPVPHYYVGATYSSDKVVESDMTPAEIWSYWEGYKFNEQLGHYKEWR